MHAGHPCLTVCAETLPVLVIGKQAAQARDEGGNGVEAAPVVSAREDAVPRDHLLGVDASQQRRPALERFQEADRQALVNRRVD